jgi:hypothetical protein
LTQFIFAGLSVSQIRSVLERLGRLGEVPMPQVGYGTANVSGNLNRFSGPTGAPQLALIGFGRILFSKPRYWMLSH